MKTEQKNIFIQYHNADNIKEFPSENLDFNTPIQNIQLNDRTKSEVWIYTRKRNVLKAQGCSSHGRKKIPAIFYVKF